MIPSVFLSSTIEDLQHLRDGVRETIADLGYTPIMSEYGDIGYLPRTSAVEACYHSVNDCQLAILIIGKRYGSTSVSGTSITHHEFITAKENNIPVITLVNQEVLSFKRVFDAQPDDKKPVTFPGMDSPAKSFGFLQEIMDAPVNNGILAYSNVTDARAHLKKQIAHIFGDLLRNAFSPLNTNLKDVLSEIKTLRHEMSGGKQPDFRFLSTIRFLVDDKNQHLKKLVENTVGPVDTAVQAIYEAESFDAFIAKLKHSMVIKEVDVNNQKAFFEENNLRYAESFPLGFTRSGEQPLVGQWGVAERDNIIVMTAPTKRFFDQAYDKMKRIIGMSNQPSQSTAVP